MPRESKMQKSKQQMQSSELTFSLSFSLPSHVLFNSCLLPQPASTVLQQCFVPEGTVMKQHFNLNMVSLFFCHSSVYSSLSLSLSLCLFLLSARDIGARSTQTHTP
jgi:hypothetical protein